MKKTEFKHKMNLGLMFELNNQDSPLSQIVNQAIAESTDSGELLVGLDDELVALQKTRDFVANHSWVKLTD